MLKIAIIHLGLKPCEFWELTPGEFNLMLECIEQKQIEKYNEMISLAWHNAVLQRQKKLQSLKTLLKKYKTKNNTKEVKTSTTKDELIELARKKGVI